MNAAFRAHGADAFSMEILETLPADAELFNEYHALLVRHAVEHCRPKPQCDGCCLKRSCRFGRSS